jgi:hypothetical protein
MFSPHSWLVLLPPDRRQSGHPRYRLSLIDLIHAWLSFYARTKGLIFLQIRLYDLGNDVYGS